MGIIGFINHFVKNKEVVHLYTHKAAVPYANVLITQHKEGGISMASLKDWATVYRMLWLDDEANQMNEYVKEVEGA